MVSSFAYSQNDSLLIKRLNRPVQDCKTIAYNSQAILSGYSISETDSINQILTIWENRCGINEPILRLKILQHIHSKAFAGTALYQRYLDDFASTFKNRIAASRESDYHKTFEYNNIYFDYVPLQSKFDKWTKTIAQNLLKKQQKGTSEYLFCLLLSEEIEKFEAERKLKAYKDNFVATHISDKEYDVLKDEVKINFIIGAWIPLGKLKPTFTTSPLLGFHSGFNFSNSVKIEIGAEFRLHIDNKPFQIEAEGTATEVKSKVGFVVGFWFSKEFKLKRNMLLGMVGGIGIGILDTDLKKNSNDDSNNYAIETADFSLGVNVRRRISRSIDIGLNLSYHYAPYNWDSQLVSNLGNQYLSLSLILGY